MHEKGLISIPRIHHNLDQDGAVKEHEWKYILYDMIGSWKCSTGCQYFWSYRCLSEFQWLRLSYVKPCIYGLEDTAGLLDTPTSISGFRDMPYMDYEASRTFSRAPFCSSLCINPSLNHSLSLSLSFHSSPVSHFVKKKVVQGEARRLQSGLQFSSIRNDRILDAERTRTPTRPYACARLLLCRLNSITPSTHGKIIDGIKLTPPPSCVSDKTSLMASAFLQLSPSPSLSLVLFVSQA